jgi:hypothetical protein
MFSLSVSQVKSLSLYSGGKQVEKRGGGRGALIERYELPIINLCAEKA